jgi:hypothetical protein
MTIHVWLRNAEVFNAENHKSTGYPGIHQRPRRYITALMKRFISQPGTTERGLTHHKDR